MSKRTNAVMVRLDDAQMADLTRLADAVGIAASTLAHNAVLALLRSYDDHGGLTLPLRMVSAGLPPPENEVLLNDDDSTAPTASVPVARKEPKPRRRRK